MNMSEKRRATLYKAIADPIMLKRMAVANSTNVLGAKNTRDIDDLLYSLEGSIWKRVRVALNISGS